MPIRLVTDVSWFWIVVPPGTAWSRRCGWIQPVVPALDPTPSQVFLPHLRRGGVDPMNLCPLGYASQLAYESILASLGKLKIGSK